MKATLRVILFIFGLVICGLAAYAMATLTEEKPKPKPETVIYAGGDLPSDYDAYGFSVTNNFQIAVDYEPMLISIRNITPRSGGGFDWNLTNIVMRLFSRPTIVETNGVWEITFQDTAQ